eukprot:TRINITY_DN1281_c0_g1_i1.p1 TRINITY_DN1281_c0_g1~~TRINITY_DN1281_c0_g1_i1.p1  ORF type:complete len:194 (-),score=29.88 TRINITY_DN1281_c0_g1_i1:221-802(-)
MMNAHTFRSIVGEGESNTELLDDGFKKDKREIGKSAVWSISSAKPGFGVANLRDGNVDTFWQSDGFQPHLVNIQFHRKVLVVEICLYLDFKSDESYTPSKMCVKAGSNFHDLIELKTVDIEEPNGWVSIPLANPNGSELSTHFLQLSILSNHQSGRDTHIRQIRVFGPYIPLTQSLGLPKFESEEFNMYTMIK